MNIWHICSTDRNLANGMINVIPCHVREQGKTEKLTLLNLGKYKYDVGNNAFSFSIDDFGKMGFNGIREKSGNPDLFVFHGIYLPAIWKFYYKYVRNNYKYVVVPHGSMVENAQKKNRWKKKIFNYLIVYSFTRNASAIHFLSKKELEDSDHKFYKNSFVAANGVSCQKKHYKVSMGGAINLLYIGRIDLIAKGLDLLIEACSNMHQFMISHQVKLHIYGPEDRNNRKKLIRKTKKRNLEQCIFFYEAVFGEDKKKVLLQTDYFIQTSRNEGMPMGILEALSYGIPLLITEGTSMGDAVRKYDCGLVAPTTVKGIENLIREAVERKDSLYQMSEAALLCAEDFYWDKIAKETLEFYKRIVETEKEVLM